MIVRIGEDGVDASMDTVKNPPSLATLARGVDFIVRGFLYCGAWEIPGMWELTPKIAWEVLLLLNPVADPILNGVEAGEGALH